MKVEWDISDRYATFAFTGQAAQTPFFGFTFPGHADDRFTGVDISCVFYCFKSLPKLQSS